MKFTKFDKLMARSQGFCMGEYRDFKSEGVVL